ncbi:MAG: hypothetical protein DMG72_18705 [Acidobacteria bacterium]|nr:MAG: hypothetical protein DMG72_18705 [Acidobacteriota bacterium]
MQNILPRSRLPKIDLMNILKRPTSSLPTSSNVSWQPCPVRFLLWAAGSVCLICWGFISAMMVWLYWTGFAMLVGAELNAELAKISSEGKLQQKQEPPAITKSISPPEDQR